MTLKGKTFSFNEETLIYQVLSNLCGVVVSGTGGKVQDYSCERASVLLMAAKAVQNSSKQFECKNKLRVRFFVVIFTFLLKLSVFRTWLQWTHHLQIILCSLMRLIPRQTRILKFYAAGLLVLSFLRCRKKLLFLETTPG